MNARIRRAMRLVELADKAEQAARVRASVAERALAAARSDAKREEDAWSDAARDFSEGVTRVTQLQEQAAYLETLRVRADAALRRVDKALAEERAAAGEVVQAATERRKLELWRDRIIEGQRAEEARIERLGADDLASRIASRAKP